MSLWNYGEHFKGVSEKQYSYFHMYTRTMPFINWSQKYSLSEKNKNYSPHSM